MLGRVAVLVSQDDRIGLAGTPLLDDAAGNDAIGVAGVTGHLLVDAPAFVFPRVAALSFPGPGFGGWTVVVHGLHLVTRGHPNKLPRLPAD